jgi:glycosyltransferase involved in cell wall biosynthesis
MSQKPARAEMTPTVSVIVASYNASRYIADSIATIQKQTLTNIEIIVSDDASTDDSVGIVTRLMAEDTRIRLLRGERNCGPAAARNRAIDVAIGKWIAVVDSDDVVGSKRLETLIEAAERDSADIVADDLVMVDPSGKTPSVRLLSGRWADAPFWVETTDYITLNRLYGSGPGLGYLKPVFCASVFREGNIRYDETLRNSEDYDLVLRLLHGGKRMRVYPLPMYIYQRHGNSISHRLSENVLETLLLSEQRFFERIEPKDLALRASAAAKINSTRVALAYERLLAAIRARRYGAALAIATANPRATALLRLPIGVRLRRFSPFRENPDRGAQPPSLDTSQLPQNEPYQVAGSSQREIER